MNKTRYKATIANQTYTIIGNETKDHMDAVVSMANQQIEKIKQALPDSSLEQSAVLLAVNALSDQLHMQEQLNEANEKIQHLEELTLELDELKDIEKKAKELEARLQRFEEYEKKAKEALKKSGQEVTELSPAEIQTVMNQEALNKIQEEHKPK